MRGLPLEHWKTLILWGFLGEIALLGAIGFGWLQSMDIDAAAESLILPFAIAPIVIGILANRRALPVVLTVYVPLVVNGFLISRTLNVMMVVVATLASLAFCAVWGRTFLVRARRYFGRNQCEECSYDLRADTTGRCPECGMVIPKAGSRPSDFPGLRKCVRRPRLAIALFLLMPLICSIVSMRYAKPYESQLKNMFASNSLVGKSPMGVNWALGSSLASDLPDNTYVIEYHYVGMYGATAYITIKDGVVVRAYLVLES